MNVVVAGVPFSPNLGDGLLAELVAKLLGRHLDQVEITSLDLADRTELAASDGQAGGSLGRATALRLHRWGPTGLLDRAYYEAKTRRSEAVITRWADALEDADMLVIGPGQLFSSRTANFPTKLSMLVDALERCGNRPRVNLLGVGADSGGSTQSRSILQRAIAGLNVHHAIVRDERSLKEYGRLGGDTSRARIAPDLAVLTEQLLPQPNYVNQQASVYVDCVDLTSYDDADGAEDVLNSYRSSVIDMIDVTGAEVVAFGSNGLIEDQLFAERIERFCAELPGVRTEVLPAPMSATDIAVRAGEYGGTVGVRLHAVLPALALGRPAATPVLTAKAAGVISSAYGSDAVERPVLHAPESRRREAIDSLEEAAQWLFAA